MIVGIGTDIVEIERIKEACSAERFLERVFTPGEREYCLGHKNPWPYLAARFAAKEAVAKALGTGIGQVGWRDIEVVKEPSGRPGIVLSGKGVETARELGIKELLLSLSHCREYAMAYVVGVSK
ncbi:MAG: holo-ACP synthase [Thermincolia bacterium]